MSSFRVDRTAVTKAAVDCNGSIAQVGANDKRSQERC